MRKTYKPTAYIMIFAMLFCTGCTSSSSETKEDTYIKYNGKVNETISDDSKWYDSMMYGAIDDSLSVRPEDDFYTYINKDWVLKETVDEDNQENWYLTDMEQLVKDRMISIVSDEEDPEAFKAPKVNISDEELMHDQNIVSQFSMTASDWTRRNELGVEPVRKYIEAIENIKDIDDMTEYILDIGGMNFLGTGLVNAAASEYGNDTQHYRVMVMEYDGLSLNDRECYIDYSIMHPTYLYKERNDEMVHHVLERLGYEEKYIDRILKLCYRFEGRLADHAGSYDEVDFEKEYSLDALCKMAGNYPLREYFEKTGYGDAEFYYAPDVSYIKFMSRVYKSGYLEEMKAYFIVKSVISAIGLLDRQCYNVWQEVESENENSSLEIPPVFGGDGSGDTNETEIKDEWDIVLNNYVSRYMAGPLDMVYVARYCSEEQKDDLKALVEKLILEYRQLVADEEWLSEDAKEKTLEKLDYLVIRVLYPDEFDSYLDLEFSEGDDLIAMVSKINEAELWRNSKITDESVDRSRWDFSLNQTSTINAYYIANSNSVNIMAGFIAGGYTYDINESDEFNYARIGTIIGHEISHAFDTTGCYFDKFGNKKTWMNFDDISIFEMKAHKIENYYNNLYGYRGSQTLNGSKVSGEVIADMGGVAVTLGLAHKNPEFDYDEYFKNYAELWRCLMSHYTVDARIEGDEHPLNFLRVNVTLMQFDDFINTYGIKEGDGMYMAPDKRIKVW